MRTKRYPAETLTQVREALADLPAQPARFVSHADALASLSKQIRELAKKGYDSRDIARIVNERGIRVSWREVRAVLGEGPRKAVESDAKPTE